MSAAAELERAQVLVKTSPQQAFEILNKLGEFNLRLIFNSLFLNLVPLFPRIVVRLDIDIKDEESVRIKEQTILELARLLSKEKQVKGIRFYFELLCYFKKISYLKCRK